MDVEGQGRDADHERDHEVDDDLMALQTADDHPATLRPPPSDDEPGPALRDPRLPRIIPAM
ncbi:hypothetical protein GCM10025780_05870 [Frondihabitans cladoniiphilus]|uniref:Uncharacterized protein n=1 Tax=Frondihabitans cladoniiphilus TaxID=715785 RepID=A0ABP8VNE3_9MICO